MSSKKTVGIVVQERPYAVEIGNAVSTIEEVQAMCPSSRDELVKQAADCTFHVLVMEQQVGEGMEDLEALLQNLPPMGIQPAIILLAELNKEDSKKARQLGVKRVLERRSTPGAIKKTVGELLSGSGFGPSDVNSAAGQLVKEFNNIPPLPQLVARLAHYFAQDEMDVDLQKMARDIEVDPSATARLLRIVNSTATGVLHRITSVFDAVKILGPRKSVAVIMAGLVLQQFQGLWKNVSPLERSWYNRRCLLIASTAQTVGESLLGACPSTSYLAGLLQDVGILVLGQIFGMRYQSILKRFRESGQLRLEAIEKSEFGFSHADVSSALLAKWKVPPLIVNLVREHHRAEEDSREVRTQKVLHAMRIAEAFANLTDGNRGQRYAQLQRVTGEMDGVAVKECLNSAIRRSVEGSRLLDLPPPDVYELQVLVDRIKASGAVEWNEDELAALSDAGIEVSKSTGIGEEFPDEAIRPTSDSAEMRIASRAGMSLFERRPSVLVIEDQTTVVDFLHNCLNRVGLEVLSCSNLNLAMCLAPASVAALVDVHLGAEHGAEVVRGLRDDGYSGPILMITGDRSRTTVEECIRAGADDYITKPFTAQHLVARLREHTGLPLELKSSNESPAPEADEP